MRGLWRYGDGFCFTLELDDFALSAGGRPIEGHYWDAVTCTLTHLATCIRSGPKTLTCALRPVLRTENVPSTLACLRSDLSSRILVASVTSNFFSPLSALSVKALARSS